MTERTIVSDEVTCPICYTKQVQTRSMADRPGYYTVYGSDCINGHKFNWKREVMIFNWAIESTEVQSEQ